jgi:hypothetical protein
MIKGLVKTYQHTNIAERDRDINEFGDKHTVFATQTNTEILGKELIIISTLFYEDKG